MSDALSQRLGRVERVYDAAAAVAVIAPLSQATGISARELRAEAARLAEAAAQSGDSIELIVARDCGVSLEQVRRVVAGLSDIA